MHSEQRDKMRSSWTFVYLGSELIEPAQRRIKYHYQRMTWWKNEAHATEVKIKETGVSLQEFPVTGGSRFEAKIDVSLANRLNEAKGKERRHRDLMEEFTCFSSEFARAPDREFILKFSDLVFFGLNEVMDEDQE